MKTTQVDNIFLLYIQMNFLNPKQSGISYKRSFSNEKLILSSLKL